MERVNRALASARPDRRHDTHTDSSGPSSPTPWPALIALFTAATVLRLWRLDSQLWHDEISALNSIRRAPAEILTRWPGSSSHILYELLAHAGYELSGTDPIGIRIPAALFGIAGVLVLFLFARRWLSTRAALFITALFTLSYHHIFFSQNARGYTALMTLSLAATHLFTTLCGPAFSSRRVLGYAALAALTVYVNPLGVFVPAGHGVVLLGRYALARARSRASPDMRAPIIGLVTAGAVTALLYLPFVPSMLTFMRMNIATPAEGPRLGVGLLVEVVEGLASGAGGMAGLAIAAVAGLVGLVAWLRLAPFALALLVTPLVVQVAVLGGIGMGLHPRYFAIALPVAFLIGGLGIERIVGMAVTHAVKRPALRHTVASTVLVLIALVSAAPLLRYYRVPKQDYLGAIRVVNERARPGDARVAIYIVNSAINNFYGGGFLHAESLAELQRIEATHERVWLVTTLERLLAAHDPTLLAHIRADYRIARMLPGSVGDGAMRIYEQRR